MTEYLALEDLLALTAELGVGPVRDLGLLESAVRRPATILWGRDAYTTINEKAAALLDSVVRNHPLVDGNKRLGWLAHSRRGAGRLRPDDEGPGTAAPFPAPKQQPAAPVRSPARP